MSDNPPCAPVDAKRARRQIRLGLVIEGGVSLAVWMSGVTHEIDLLRRAGEPGRGPLPEGADEALTRWRALCDDLNVDVIVDVIAGTSAGGLNGAFLASAIASGRPLPPLKELWRTAAQLRRGRLLRDAGTQPLDSLFNGQFFADQLASVFAQALGDSDEPPAGAHPVTLLTTATALGEQMSVWADSSGKPFDVSDHRRVYRFRNDPSAVTYTPPGAVLPGDPFELFTPADPRELRAGTVPALTRAARATAGFPGAFEPVDEQDDGADLCPYRVCGATGHGVLVDGGVLDNTPFEPLVDEIGRRQVEGDWRRVIGYVVANDGLAGSTVTAQGVPVGIAREWFPVLTSAMRMSSETSFRHGVEALAQRALEAERLVSGPERLFEQVLDGRFPDSTVDSLFDLYRQNRAEAGVLDAYLVRNGRRTVRPVCVPPLSDVRPEAASLWVPPAPFSAALAAPRWLWGTAVAERAVRLLIRHLHSWGVERAVEVGDQLKRLSEVLTAVMAMRDFIADRLGTTRSDEPEVLLAAVDQATKEAHGPDVLQALMVRAAQAYAAARRDLAAGPDSVLRATLAVEVLTQAVAGRLPFSRPARFQLIRMGPDITSPIIEAPALPGGAPREFGDWKLYGTQLGHFGAFGREEWREHDFVWGRLDGAAHLVRLLVLSAETPLCDDEARRRTVAAQEAALADEHADPARLAAALRGLCDLNTRMTLDAIRREPEGQQAARDTVADALRMLQVRADGTPPAVPLAGAWLAAVLALKLAKGQPPLWLPWILRRFTGRWPRRRFWRWVSSPRVARPARP